MEIGIEKKELPSLVERYLTYLGGIICGVGVGMFVAVEFVTEDDRRIFHIHYFVTAWVCVLLGTLVASLFRRKTPKTKSDDAQNLA
jgi:CDP-diglyceride synthetase